MVSALKDFLCVCPADYINYVRLPERLSGLINAGDQHSRRTGAINEHGGIQAIVTVATDVTVVTKIGEQCLSAAGARFTVRKECV